MGQAAAVSGPDFSQGVLLADIPAGGMLAGHVDDTPVLLSRLDGELYAVSGSCTHYGGPLAEGRVDGETVTCPWHHACFSLRTGVALKAPAFAPLACWKVEQDGDRVFVHALESAVYAAPAIAAPAHSPGHVLLVGGGAAAFACAERLRGQGFNGRLTMLSAEADPPCDRPNLSKDYLAGTAAADWIPLQPAEFYQAHAIDLRLDCKVTSLDVATKQITTRAGDTFTYDALVLATGAEPIHIPLPGFDRPNVFRLRSLADANALLAGIADAQSVAIIGAGFIGMEAASALRERGLAVHVIAPETLPLQRILGPQLAEHLTGLHRAHGVCFHLGARALHFDGECLHLSDGSQVAADAVLVGVGVRPRIALAQAAGLAVDNGILVDDRLRTSADGVYAAGDVACYPHGQARARVEHWVHAQRQGQCVADNLLGADRAFCEQPFFWTHHYGIDLRYLGHGAGWNRAELEGSPADNDCLVRYFHDDMLVAAAAIGRDRDLLALEARLQPAGQAS